MDKVLSVEIFLSPGYRLKAEEDATIYSDSGDLDQLIPRRQWPDKELPEVPEVPQPAPTQASAKASADRAQLISDLQTVYDSATKSLEAIHRRALWATFLLYLLEVHTAGSAVWQLLVFPKLLPLS